ncbi:MAG: hypothetical protein QOG53_3129 [Frankiales bacterium]|jgi:predicted transcriptional regulator|nr:hypothetical protein [Frankiales bacterium]
MFESLGLTSEQVTLYSHLTRLPRVAEADLAGRLNLSERAVSKTVKQLEELGFVNRYDDGSIAAVPPRLAMEPLVADRVREIEQDRRAIWQLHDAFEQSHTSERDPLRLIDLLPTRESVVLRFQQLNREVSEQFRGFDAPPYISERRPPNADEVDALARGVAYRIIYAREAVEDLEGLDHIEAHLAAGEQARVTENLPFKMSICDDKLAIIGYRSQQASGYTALVVHPSPLLTALIELFEIHWRLATPVPDANTDSSLAGLGITEEDLRLMTLMAASVKDEAIGRQLGVSKRTVERRVRDLLLAFNVGSRQQLLLVFAQRGLLPEQRHHP